MDSLNIKYNTITKSMVIGDKLYVMEVIRDLDEAIDQICDAMTPEQKLDPFAEDLCPYFGVLWPSAVALSQFLVDQSHLLKNKKVLELGCGVGLPSMVATHLGAWVTATDFHPHVAEYFERNCRHSGINCSYQRLNWREGEWNHGEFDIVMGSDVLYESKHPKEVALGLLRFLKPGGKILLSDPGRNYLQQFINAMKDLGYQENYQLIRVEDKEHFVFIF